MGKAIGIDLGTTNTVVSYENKKGKIVTLRINSERVVPSVLYFNTRNDFIIGGPAKNRYNNLRDQAGVDNFKSKLDDAEFRYDVVAADKDQFLISAKSAMNRFLNKIVNAIENRLIKEFGPEEGCIDKVVITTPAKFTMTQKNIIKQAAMEAGFDNVKIAPEPAAAARAYLSENVESTDKTILVYDFGGGTFDISVMQEKDNGIFAEIETDGDKKLGGNNLTDKVVAYITDYLGDEEGFYLPLDSDEFDESIVGISFADYQRNMKEIWTKADIAKADLSEESETTVWLNLVFPGGQPKTVSMKFNREQFNDLIRDDIRRTVEMTERVIATAEEKGVHVDRIVLAGGTSSILLIREMLNEALPKYPISFDDSFDEDPSTLISRGAAILSRQMTDEDLDTRITNSQFGIAVTDGTVHNKFEMLIRDGESLPCSATKSFSLLQDGQKTLAVRCCDYDVKNFPNSKRVDQEGVEEIDVLQIDNLPDGLKKDSVSIDVTFTCRSDGGLDVSVVLKDKQGNIIVAPNTLSYMKSSQLE